MNTGILNGLFLTISHDLTFFDNLWISIKTAYLAAALYDMKKKNFYLHQIPKKGH